MTQRGRIVTLVLAAAALAAAALLGLLALDVKRWSDTLADSDLRFATAPGQRDLWEPRTSVPKDAARRLLAVDDDLAYRDAIRTFRLSRPREPSYGKPYLAILRAEAQSQLTGVARDDRVPVRQAEAANLVGVLALAVGAREDIRKRVAFFESGVSYFQAAAQLDPANEDAKYNLELALRRIDRYVTSLDLPGTERPRDDASKAGLRNPGSGY